MKKISHITILFLTLFALSCKKEHAENNNPDDKLYNVTVKLGGGGFTQSIAQSGNLKVNATVTDPALFRNYFDLLMVSMYVPDAPGGGTSYLLNDSTKNITTINISKRVKPGTYTIKAFGAKYGFDGYNSYFENNKRVRMKDTFYGEKTFTVTNADVTESINLARITALLEINITDVLPLPVTRLSLDFTEKDNPTKLLDTLNINIPVAQRGKPNFKISYFSLWNGTSFDLTIKAYDKTNLPLTVKIIKNITLTTNQKSVFNGTLFGGPSSGSSSSGFPTKVDTTWNPVQIIRTF